jgi:hypothetical protein
MLIFVRVSFAPFDRAEGIPTTIAAMETTHAAFFLLHFFSSMSHDPGTSIMEMVEVRAAMHKSKKKNAPTIFPPGISLKICGNI